jgi:hypothetical protein
VDDHYENETLAEIAEKGLKPGNLISELADRNAQKTDSVGGRSTLFGEPGWGPHGNGLLNAVQIGARNVRHSAQS